MVAVMLVVGIVGCLWDPISDLFSGGLSLGGSSGGGGGSSGGSDKVVEGSVTVHFVDVGQGDCTVICTENGNMIIDAGTNSSEEEMLSYINKLGIKSFKYAIFTHPHEDHIGGAEKIMRNYRVENVIIPDMAATSKVYETMLDSIEESGANVKVIGAGEEYSFSIGSLKAKILAPIEIDNDANNASIVTRVSFGSTDLLFMGDAEEGSEELILSKYRASQLSADIIKLGHHGSSTSSSEELLDAVKPKVAIVSCGKDNKYGHPHVETVQRLDARQIEYRRTDNEGSIVCVITSEGYTFK